MCSHLGKVKSSVSFQLHAVVEVMLITAFCNVQVLEVTWWLFSQAGSPPTFISTVLLGKFPMRPRAATTPAAHSVVQVSTHTHTHCLIGFHARIRV